MQNRFGIKDFLLFVLVAIVGLMVLLNMVKTNREWDKLGEVRGKIGALETQMAASGRETRSQMDTLKSQVSGVADAVSSVQTQLKEGVTTVRNTPISGGTVGTDAGKNPVRGADGRDTSWAVPGVPIEWQLPYQPATDAREQAGFREGGAFTEIFEAQPAKLTPYIQTDVYGRRVVDIVADTLGDFDPKTLKLRGKLADAWQMDPEGMWVRARIRSDAKFSDGMPVTAEDLRWTFHEFVMNPEIEAQRTRSTVADQVKSIEVLSERVVEVRFKQRLFSNLMTALTFYVLPKHFYSTLTPSQVNKGTGLLMGSGPYKLRKLDIEDQWKPGDSVELVRNEQYWGVRPALDTIRFRAITDELARLTVYRNGEGDMITPAAPQFVTLRDDPEFSKNNQLFSQITMRSGRSGIIWNCGERGSTKKLTPFADKRVRQAMTMLLDRDRMIRDIWRGVGKVAKGFMNPEFEGSDPSIEAWPYDPPRAMKLLADAGWKDRDGNGILENEQGQEFQFQFTFFTGGEISLRIAKFLEDAYAAAGIRAIPNGVDWSVGDPIRKQRDFDAMLMGWGANAPESDPKQIFHSDSIKDQGDNFGQWNSPAADKAIDAGRLEVDFAKRMEHWRAFDRAMHDEQPYSWIRVQPETRIVKPNIGNARMYPKGIEPWEFFRAEASLMKPN